MAEVVTPVEHRDRIGGIELAWFEWGAPGDAPTILLVHATGFHARCWDRVVEHLPGRHVLAVDLRGHGRSGNDGPITWDRIGEDLIDFVRERGLSGAIGVGHSMGGHCVTQAAAALPEAFSRLVLVDPVILPPEAYAERLTWDDGEEHPTAKRRNDWTGWAAMRDRFADRMPFAAWDPRVLEDYCRFGVVPKTDGEGWELACPPKVEAAIYMGSAGSDVYEQVRAVAVPVTVLRARDRGDDRSKMDFSGSPTWARLAEQFPDGRDVHLPDRSHFIPMEDPALTAAYVLGER